MKKIITVAALVCLSGLALSACDHTKSAAFIVKKAKSTRLNFCEQHADCGKGKICDGGVCVAGSCVPSYGAEECSASTDVDKKQYCCKPWQICNEQNTCEQKPNTKVGNECEADSNCQKVGQFCHAGHCYDAVGRAACSRSSQCTSDERCDTRVHLCVPNLGNCKLADSFPELMCEAGHICDDELDVCVPVRASQCSDDGEKICPRNLKCRKGQCVQCLADKDCGAGTACDMRSGTCYSVLNHCEQDQDCPSNKRCIRRMNECVVPTCTTDQDCAAENDSRYKCSRTTYSCFLPPPQCEESRDESSLFSSAEIVASGYEGVLCRGDTDVVAISVNPKKRARIQVMMDTFLTNGVEAALLEQGVTLQAKKFAESVKTLSFQANNRTDQATVFYVRLTGSSQKKDSWRYSIRWTESDVPPFVNCSASAQNTTEPNNDMSHASKIDMSFRNEVRVESARCLENDVDYYLVDIKPQHTFEAALEYDHTLGDLNLMLCQGGSCQYASDTGVISSSSLTGDLDQVSAAEGLDNVWLKVYPKSTNSEDQDAEQSYSLTLKQVPRPLACAADIGEPSNDDLATALELPANQSFQAIRCRQDVDFYRLTLPAGFGGLVKAQFKHEEGDLRIDLMQGNTVIDSSNSSNTTKNYESIFIAPSSQDRVLFAKIRLHGSSTTIAEDYSISFETYQASSCLNLEPEQNQAISTATSVALPAQVEGQICGLQDEDWYKIGKLVDGQIIDLQVQSSMVRMLGVELWRATNAGGFAKRIDADQNGKLRFVINNPLDQDREYFIRVYAHSNLPTLITPYVMSLSSTQECRADLYETTRGNNDFDTATLLRTIGVTQNYSETISATLCGSDQDVYKVIYALSNEKLNVRLTAPPGFTVKLKDMPGLVILDQQTDYFGALLVKTLTIGVNRTQEIYLTVEKEDPSAEGRYELMLDVERDNSES